MGWVLLGSFADPSLKTPGFEDLAIMREALLLLSSATLESCGTQLPLRCRPGLFLFCLPWLELDGLHI